MNDFRRFVRGFVRGCSGYLASTWLPERVCFSGTCSSCSGLFTVVRYIFLGTERGGDITAVVTGFYKPRGKNPERWRTGEQIPAGATRFTQVIPAAVPIAPLTEQKAAKSAIICRKCFLGCFIRPNLSSCPKSSQNHGAATGFDEKHPPLDCVDHGAGRYVSDLLANARLLMPALIVSPR